MDARPEGRRAKPTAPVQHDRKGNAVMAGTSAQQPSQQASKPAHRSERRVKRPGLTFGRYFTRDGVDPFGEVDWELRDATIKGADGQVYFEQRDVEFPRSWSQTATNVVVQKYFRGTLNTPQRERSVKQMIAR